MTGAERDMLLEIQDQCKGLARRCKQALDQGFLVSFSINNGTGEVDVFKVTQMVELDLSSRTQ